MSHPSFNLAVLLGRVVHVREFKWPNNTSFSLRLQTARIKATPTGPKRSWDFHEVMISTSSSQMEARIRKEIHPGVVLLVMGRTHYREKDGQSRTDIYCDFWEVVIDTETLRLIEEVKERDSHAGKNAFKDADNRQEENQKYAGNE